jgi:hypothetical protein
MSRSFRGNTSRSRSLARDLLRTKRTIADYDYYADQDRYVSQNEVEAEAQRLVNDIIRTKAAQRTAAIRSRTAQPRTALEMLERMSMTADDRQQLIKTRQMFPGLELSDDVVKKLKSAGDNVVPVKYYECPVSWNEYTDVTANQINTAGVVWQNAKGNFCMPPAVTDTQNRVDSFEYNRLPSEQAVRRQLGAQLKSLRQMQETPEERSRRLAAEKRVEDSRTRRVTQAKSAEANRKNVMNARAEQEEIRNLMEILQNLPNGKYASMTGNELRAKAKKMYDTAHGCADLTGKKSTCNNNPQCTYGVGGSCYPKAWAKEANDELTAIRQANKTGVPLSRSQAEGYAENEAMVEWWQEYYPAFRARQRAEKAKEVDENSIVRSLMSAN